MTTIARTAAAAALCVLMLSACAPAAEPTGSAGSTPGSSPAKPAKPAKTPSATPSPTAVATGPLIFPGCGDLYTPDEVAELIGGLEPQDSPTAASMIPALTTLLDTADALRCAWVIPGSERGLWVTLVRADAGLRGTVAATLVGEGVSPTTSAPFDRYAFTLEPEGNLITEAHTLGPDIWVTARDLNGTNAIGLVQAALDKVVTLNPGRF